MTPPRLLIEDWLPAAAIGVECIRERSTGQQPPDKRLHVWWARRPLAASRAAVLGSLLPADFPRDVFERLLGFWGPSQDILAAQRLLDWARSAKVKVPNPHGGRAFSRKIESEDLRVAHHAAQGLWDEDACVIDPMAGGGSIPLESARLGFRTLANEYNPVACTVLEATLDYTFRFGSDLSGPARKWAAELRKRFVQRMEQYFPRTAAVPPHCYIFARTVPCPDTQHPTPLVPDWHLLKSKSGGGAVVAEPVIHKAKGTWSIRVRDVGTMAGMLKEPPNPTYKDGKGISLFSGHQIPSDYIKAKAQAGEMGSALYAIAIKTPQGLKFVPPSERDLEAIEKAAVELAKQRPQWERENVIPTELYPEVSSDERPRAYGMPRWADMFSPRQLLGFGVLVEELRKLRSEIVKAEGDDRGGAIEHLLAFVLDKFCNWNAILSSWNPPAGTARSVFDRHDFSFKSTYCEMAPCGAGVGLDWACNSTIEAFEEVAKLSKAENVAPVSISLGSAANLPQLGDGCVTAVVVDPPYADNVQYSELADFFYVWLKRTQGHRRPEWFSSYLCEHDQEAVVNVPRHREAGTNGASGKREGSAAEAKAQANIFYQTLMRDVFRESRRILRDDGVLTVMFTHKKQEAWEALFSSLIEAGFVITATWPIKTEGWHSLHQAKKNAAQSTVLLVARKRAKNAGTGYFDAGMKRQIRDRARAAAERLAGEGLNPVDQLVGSFGPAMEVFSRYDTVKTDTGTAIRVAQAIDEASEAVSQWRESRLAARGLSGIEAEGRFAAVCWDVLGAEEFRYNEAHLLGKAVGMEVDQLVVAGLVTKSGDKIKILPAKERRRERALEREQIEETLFGPVSGQKKRVRRADALKVHPNDPVFRTALDGCHALALRYLEADGGGAGVGSAKALCRQQGWSKEAAVARLMEALVNAAPEAMWHEKGKKSAAARFPEFRAWHELLSPLFGIAPPDWTEKKPPQTGLFDGLESEAEGEENEDSEEGEEE